VTRGQFTPVVQDDTLRPATLEDDGVKRPGHSPAWEAGVYFESQALTRKRIDDCEDANGPAARQSVMQEVEGPLLVRRRTRSEGLTCAHQALALLPLHAQACSLIYPEDALVVHHISLPAQQHFQASISIPRLLLCQFGELLSKLVIFLFILFIPERGSGDVGQLAGGPLSRSAVLDEKRRVRATFYELNP